MNDDLDLTLRLVQMDWHGFTVQTQLKGTRRQRGAERLQNRLAGMAEFAARVGVGYLREQQLQQLGRRLSADLTNAESVGLQHLLPFKTDALIVRQFPDILVGVAVAHRTLDYG